MSYKRVEMMRSWSAALQEALVVVRVEWPADTLLHDRMVRHFERKFQQTNDSLWLGAGWAVAGRSATGIGAYETAYAMNLRAWKLFERRNRELEAALLALQLAIVQQYRLQNADALRWLDRCLSRLPKGQEQTRAAAYTIRGNVNFQLQNYPQALEAFNLALKLLHEQNNLMAQVNVYGNLGTVYAMLDRQDSSRICAELAYRINQTLPKHNKAIEPITNMGYIYFEELKEPDKAAQYFKEAISLAESNPAYSANLPLALMGLADIYKEKRQPQDALPHLWRAEHIAREAERWDLLGHVYPCLTRAHAQAFSPDDSIKHYLGQIATTSDTLNALVRSREIQELQMKYEVEKKDRKLAAQAAEARLSRLLMLGMGILIMILLVIAALLFRARKREKDLRLAQRRHNAIIYEQKKELTQHTEELSARGEELAAANAKLQELSRFKDTMMGMIVHDLKNPLNAVMMLAQMMGDNPQAKTIYQAGQQMLNLTLNLLDVQKYERSVMQAERAKTSLNRLIDGAFEQVDLIARPRRILLSRDTPQDVSVLLDESLTVRLLVNLLTNAIKYSPLDSEVRLVAETSGRLLRFRVIDQGPGVPPNFRETVFEKFVQVEARDSGLMASTGLGLAFCRMAAEAHGGRIWIEDNPERQGSVFCVDLAGAALPVGESFEIAAPASQAPQEGWNEEALEMRAQIARQLQDVPHYEFSRIAAILDQLPVEAPQSLQAWAEEVQEAALSGNRLLYENLLAS